MNNLQSIRAISFKGCDLSRERAIVTRLSRNGSHTIVSDQRNMNNLQSIRAISFKGCDLSRERAIVTRLSRNGSHTMVSDQRNKGESNDEIQEAICCRPGVAHRARPVPAGNGTEHHSIQHLDDDTESTSRSDAEHHQHDITGSGIGAAGPSHSEY